MNRYASMTEAPKPKIKRNPKMNVYLPTPEEAAKVKPDYLRAWRAFAEEAHKYPTNKSFTDYLYETAMFGLESGHSFKEIEEVLNNQRLFMTEVACRTPRPKVALLDSFIEYSKKVAKTPVFVVCSKDLSFVYYAWDGAERIQVVAGDSWIKEEPPVYLAA